MCGAHPKMCCFSHVEFSHLPKNFAKLPEELLSLRNTAKRREVFLSHETDDYLLIKILRGACNYELLPTKMWTLIELSTPSIVVVNLIVVRPNPTELITLTRRQSPQ